MTGQSDARELLAAERASTLGRLGALERELRGIIESAELAGTDDEHDPEGATIAFEREHLTALLDQTRDQLGRVDAALRRVDEGTYGVCEHCGEPIAPARLEARPTAALCIACASQSNR